MQLSDFQLDVYYFMMILHPNIRILAKCSAKKGDYRLKSKFLRC